MYSYGMFTVVHRDFMQRNELGSDNIQVNIDNGDK